MLTLPFTVAVFMVRNFEAGEQMDEARIGRLTGLLAALYSFTQCTTSLPWGVVSNRIGRKPIIVIGLGASFSSRVPPPCSLPLHALATPYIRACRWTATTLRAVD